MKRFLDIDDIESITSDRLAELYRLNNRMSSARRSRRYADVHRLREERYLRSFDGVFVCSDDDAALLRKMYQCPAFVLPNTVDDAASCAFEQVRKIDGFVRRLDGLPPERRRRAAARRCCSALYSAVLPGTARVVIVGSRPPDSVLALGTRSCVTVTGAVDYVTPYYRQATVAVVPLRAGGGTRIKILEAAAHRVPVVSTPVGAEGLDVADGHELLLAHTPEQMAHQCVRLWQDRRPAVSNHPQRLFLGEAQTHGERTRPSIRRCLPAVGSCVSVREQIGARQR